MITIDSQTVALGALAVVLLALQVISILVTRRQNGSAADGVRRVLDLFDDKLRKRIERMRPDVVRDASGTTQDTKRLADDFVRYMERRAEEENDGTND